MVLCRSVFILSFTLSAVFGLSANAVADSVSQPARCEALVKQTREPVVNHADFINRCKDFTNEQLVKLENCYYAAEGLRDPNDLRNAPPGMSVIQATRERALEYQKTRIACSALLSSIKMNVGEQKALAEDKRRNDATFTKIQCDMMVGTQGMLGDKKEAFLKECLTYAYDDATELAQCSQKTHYIKAMLAAGQKKVFPNDKEIIEDCKRVEKKAKDNAAK